jgi:hypothetical protein
MNEGNHGQQQCSIIMKKKHRTTQQDERDRDSKVMNNRATGSRRKHDQATVWSKREEDKERQEVDGYKGKGK